MSHTRRPYPDQAEPTLPSRRRVLQLGGAGLVAAASVLAGRNLTQAASGLGVTASFGGGKPTRRQAGDELVLVVIELDGGLDGFNTVVPYQAGAYRDLRGDGALGDDELIVLDDEFAIHHSLENIARRWDEGQVALVHGVGIEDNSLSHFTSADIWSRGRVETGDGTGWLGRALDEVADRSGGAVDPLTGISIGYLSPALTATDWSAVALPDDGTLPWSADFVEANPGIVAAYQQMLATPVGDAVSLRDRVRNSQQLVRSVAQSIGEVTDLDSIVAAAELLEPIDVPDDTQVGDGLLPARLGMVADLIAGGLPTRAYHVVHGGFDTHASQKASLPYLLAELDQAVEGFWRRLDAADPDLAQRVVIATRSEFGRRPEWNGSGTDHGSAGVQLVFGPRVAGGHHGEPSPLDRFDGDENFLVTTDFRRYLGGLAGSVLGADPTVAVPGVDRPLSLLAS